jgi:hypothetical protein
MTSVLADSFSASSNVLGQAYPCINADLSVTFRLLAPSAASVQILPGPMPREGEENGLGKGPMR